MTKDWKHSIFLVWLWLIPFTGNAVTPMVASSGHTLVLKNDGTVLAFGDDSFGQLGLGRAVQSATPVQAQGLTGVAAIGTGWWHNLAVKSDGSVWAWGYNDSGGLGDGTATPSNVPVAIQGLSGVTAVTGGMNHSVALTSDGAVWTWGWNRYGQLGNGTTVTAHNSRTFYRVTGVSRAIRVAAGDGHTVALQQDGTIVAWGKNDSGQLGVGGTSNRSVATAVIGLTGVNEIAAGVSHTLAVAGGSVWAWGNNQSAQLGDGTTTNRAVPVRVQGLTGVVAIAAGAAHGAALREDRSVWTWGNNQLGQLGDGTTTSRLAPIQVPGLTGVRAIAAGAGHTVALTTDGSLWAWGSNESGELGDGTTTSRLSPVQVATGLSGISAIAANWGGTVAMISGGTVWAWGSNGYGQLGNGAIDNRSIPATVQGLSGVARIAANGMNSLALKQDGTVWAWGRYFSFNVNASYSAYSVPAPVPGLSNATGIASGFSGGLAIQDGAAWAWGGNAYGELGDGTTIDRASPGQVTGLTGVTAVSGGGFYALALASDGSVWGWGRNDYGQTGPTSQQTCTNVGDSDVPCNPLPTRIPNLSDVIAISAVGDYQGAALKRDGSVWVWGNWSCDQSSQSGSGIPTRVPGLSDVVAFASSQAELLVIGTDRTVWTRRACSSAPSQVPELSSVIAVSAGDHTMFAVRADGTVWSWGDENRYGNLGNGTYAASSTPALVVNETVNGPLDLIPEVTNSIPPDKIPPFFVATYKSGGLSATSLYADIRGLVASATFAGDLGKFAAGYNVYVAASVPSMQSPYFQLDSNNNWSALNWPMAEFMRGVALDSQNTLVRAQILQNVNVSQLPGASIIVGYGTDPDEMARSGRYRTIFTVSQP